MTALRPLRAVDPNAFARVWSARHISSERIGAFFGVSGSAVRQKAKALGLPSRADNTEAKRRGSDAEFRRLYEAGVSLEGIAKALGYASHRGVCHRRDLLGLPNRTRGNGTGKHAGWQETITLRQYQEAELGRMMADAAQGAR